MVSSASGSRPRSGFTLIELMLTLALIALLSSIFVWNINSLLKQGALEALQNEMWSAVEKAKQRKTEKASSLIRQSEQDDVIREKE